jgi:predicted transcriptional regulator
VIRISRVRLVARTVSRESTEDTLVIDTLDKLLKFRELFTSDTRIKIFYYIVNNDPISIKELSEITDIPISVVSKHVSKLEKLGLIFSGIRNGSRGLRKVLRKRFSKIVVKL